MGIQKSHKGIEYIDVKLTAPWMGRKPVYQDGEKLFVMEAEVVEELLDKGFLTPPLREKLAEHSAEQPGMGRIRARAGEWWMYAEDGSVLYRIHKTDKGLEVFSAVPDMEATQTIPMTRLMAEKLIGRKAAVKIGKKKPRPAATETAGT